MRMRMHHGHAHGHMRRTLRIGRQVFETQARYFRERPRIDVA